MKKVILLILLAPLLASAEDVKVGQPAPAFKLRDLDNRVFSIEDLAYPGPEKPGKPKKVVLLDFFRTDCPPCKRKLPHVIALHNRLKDQGFTAVLVALLEEAEGETKLRSYLEANPVPFVVVIDRHEYAAKRYIPVEGGLALGTMVLIDRDGIIRAKTDDEQLIELLLKGLFR